MNDVEVLWLDDDITTSSKNIMKDLGDRITGVKLLTAKSCGESERMLKSRHKPPQWAVVDLIVPQGGWDHEQYHSNPGIEYIKHLKARYGNEIKIVAFSILVTKDIAEKVKTAGATEAFVKSNTSFAGILEKIKQQTARETPNITSDNEK